MAFCMGCGKELTTADPPNSFFCNACQNRHTQNLWGWTCPSCGVNYSPFVSQCACSKHIQIDISNHGTHKIDTNPPDIDSSTLEWSSSPPTGLGGYYVVWENDPGRAHVAVISHNRKGIRLISFPNWLDGAVVMDGLQELKSAIWWARIPTDVRPEDDTVLSAMR